jgi:hypothetical protein
MLCGKLLSVALTHSPATLGKIANFFNYTWGTLSPTAAIQLPAIK